MTLTGYWINVVATVIQSLFSKQRRSGSGCASAQFDQTIAIPLHKLMVISEFVGGEQRPDKTVQDNMGRAMRKRLCAYADSEAHISLRIRAV